MFRNIKIKIVEKIDPILKDLEKSIENTYIKIYNIYNLNMYVITTKKEKIICIVK